MSSIPQISLQSHMHKGLIYNISHLWHVSKSYVTNVIDFTGMTKRHSVTKVPSFLCLIYAFLFSAFVCLVFSFVLLPARDLEAFLAMVPKILVIFFSLSKEYFCTHCRDGFVVTNSPSSSVTQNHLVSVFISTENFAGYKNNRGRWYALRSCSTSIQALFELKVFDQRSAMVWMCLHL